MRITFYSVVRLAVVASAVLSGAAVLSHATASSPQIAEAKVAPLNDGPAPTPYCDPSNPKCKIPTMNPW